MKTVCLFVKSPRLGKAKTRLARDIGAARAALIYCALVEHQAAEIPLGWRVAVYFAPSNAGEDMKIWLAPQLQNGTRFVPQCDGDLGQRLVTAVRREFDNGSERIRLPVTAKIAFEIAGATGGIAGSPKPVGGLLVGGAGAWPAPGQPPAPADRS